MEILRYLQQNNKPIMENILNEVKEYKEILLREQHHKHEIVDVDGVIRWKENKRVSEMVDRIGLNNILLLFEMLGYSKNSEIYRKLYRDIGYSLSGYYDVFYWEANNEEADEYNPENKIYEGLAKINNFVDKGNNRWIGDKGIWWYLTKVGFRMVDGKI